MKRLLSLTVAAMLLAASAITVHAKGAPKISAPSAILIEKSTGTVLFEKSANEQRPPASVTKIMTLLLIEEAIENGQYAYSDTVTASANAAAMGGSQVYLKENEQLTVDEMLKCIVIASANDACVAMAEFTSGSVSRFVEQMNERAAELGMTATEFKNCTGLDADGHLTTARDIATMSRELLKHEDIKKYTKIQTDSIRDGAFVLTNTNKLIRSYGKATGLKTGYTKKSGYCISATAQDGGTELITVIMGAASSSERNNDARTLLEHGFSDYELVTATPDVSTKTSVLKGKEKSIRSTVQGTLSAVVKKEQKGSVSVKTELAKDVEAPVISGQRLGYAQLMLEDNILAECDIVASRDVQRAGFSDIFMRIFNYFLIV